MPRRCSPWAQLARNLFLSSTYTHGPTACNIRTAGQPEPNVRASISMNYTVNYATCTKSNRALSAEFRLLWEAALGRPPNNVVASNKQASGSLLVSDTVWCNTPVVAQIPHVGRFSWRWYGKRSFETSDEVIFINRKYLAFDRLNVLLVNLSLLVIGYVCHQ